MIKVSPMTWASVPLVAELENSIFTLPWSEDTLYDELDNPTARFLVASDDGNVLGYIGANNICGEWYIDNIAVREDARRRGVGSMLMSSLIEKARNENALFLTLEVRPSNTPAIRLYEKFGFTVRGERKGFYSEPKEDAFIMTVDLQDEE